MTTLGRYAAMYNACMLVANLGFTRWRDVAKYDASLFSKDGQISVLYVVSFTLKKLRKLQKCSTRASHSNTGCGVWRILRHRRTVRYFSCLQLRRRFMSYDGFNGWVEMMEWKKSKRHFVRKISLKFSHPFFIVHTARVIFCLVSCFFSSGFALFKTIYPPGPL